MLRGIPISYEAGESVEPLSPGAALCGYRIAQEALARSETFEAEHVEARVSRYNGNVRLSVPMTGSASRQARSREAAWA